MSEDKANRPKRPPTHPGAIIKEDVLPAIGMKIAPAARELGISRQLLHNIMNGKAAVTPRVALRLGKFCGNGPDVWLAMQMKYDLWAAGREMEGEIAAIPTHTAA